MVETNGAPPGLPCFSQLVLARIWDVAEYCPQATLEWLSAQVPRNKLVHNWVLQGLDTWVEHFLIGHSNQRVRSGKLVTTVSYLLVLYVPLISLQSGYCFSAAAYLLASLVPSQSFRQGFRTARPTPTHYKEILSSPDALSVLHKLLDVLFRLLKPARHYADVSAHGTNKLTAYFSLLSYSCMTNTEKLMVRAVLLCKLGLYCISCTNISNSFSAPTIFYRFVESFPPKIVRACCPHPSQQAGLAALLAPCL